MQPKNCEKGIYSTFVLRIAAVTNSTFSGNIKFIKTAKYVKYQLNCKLEAN